MAIDPMYIRVPDVPEFAAGGEASLMAGDRELLARCAGSAASTTPASVS